MNSSIECGVLFFLVVPVVISLRAMLLALTRPQRSSADPACELCRYKVAGLHALVCPECGTDLRRTGIITPAMEMRPRGSTGGAIIGWTAIAFFVLMGTSAVIMDAARSRWTVATAGAVADRIQFWIVVTCAVTAAVWAIGVVLIVLRRRILLREIGAMERG